MRKTILMFVILLVSCLSVYSQDSIPKLFYGKLTQYRYCNVVENETSKWSEWTKSSANITVYFDWGFGLLGVTNKDYNRYMFIGQISDEYLEGNRIFKIKSVDNSYVICQTDIEFKKDKTIRVKIEYSNLMYEYIITEMKVGYPYNFFKLLEFKNDSIKKSTPNIKINKVIT